MKIQLDTKLKTITIEEKVNLDEFFKFIKTILPESWKQYTLQTYRLS